MKYFYLTSIILLLALPAFAQSTYISDPPNISESSFANASNGFAVSLILGEKIENGVTVNYIQITLKNNNSTDRFYSTVPSLCQMELYYVDASGTQIPMKEYKYNLDIPSEPRPVTITPGHTLSRIIKIKNPDLAILQSKPIVLKVSIFNGTDFERIISSPKSLVPTP